MDFIYTIFGTPLGWIMWAIYQVIPIYAIALLLFTVLSKVLLFPLAVKQHKATVQQAVFRPKLDELKKKYANDKKKQQEEMMRLQQEEGMSLTGGCSSLLIQMPILFGLIDVVYKPLTHILHVSGAAITSATEVAKNLGYTISGMSGEIAIMKAVKEHPSAFNGISDNFASLVTNTNFSLFGLDLTAVPTMALNWMLLFPLLTGGTMIIQSMVSSKLNPAYDPSAPGAKSTKIMLYSMSLLFIYFSFSVPAGVSFYWALTNVLMIAQQFILNKRYNPKELAEQMRAESEARKKAKRTVKSTTTTSEGKVSVGEKVLTQKEYEKLRLARARQLDAEKYGEDLPEEETK